MEKEKPYHIPVLVKEVLEYLAPRPDGIYLDVTFGGGGHTRAILAHEPKCEVVAMDWDLSALERNGLPLQEEFPDRLTLVWGNFTQLDKKLKKVGIHSVDGILADFGTSQFQLTERPGFSFHADTELDMRMSSAHQKITAADVVNNATEKELITIFKELGEEHQARAIARLIVQERKKKKIKTTKQLTQIIERIKGPKGPKRIHPATKAFQALRIYVNKELENIAAFFPAALRVLKPGGKLVCISFHSLEDRLVKQFFKELATQAEPKARLLAPKAISASPEEVAQNSASRSAKLRAIELI
ncbi:MAG: 16S rRNA (cytosine(1402)-N(4))-methyltransferase RsmH [Candidatus Babeliales bacterium]